MECLSKEVRLVVRARLMDYDLRHGLVMLRLRRTLNGVQNALQLK